MSGQVFLVAAEASGDALGADLARALKQAAPALEMRGVGGPLMAQAGVASEVEIGDLAILGFVDGLLAYKRVKRAVELTVQAILSARPSVVVLIDSWGFTLRVAQSVRKAAPDIKLVKYIGPQVWATRPGRAKTLAATVDHLICIHDFEEPFYKPYGLPTTVSGHPAIGRFTPGDAQAFRQRHGFQNGERILLVLPGSRSSEISRVAPTLWRAADLLRREFGDTRIVAVVASLVQAAVREQAPSGVYLVDEAEKQDAFAAATVAIAASGTVTTEVALQGAPLVIGYKLGWITWTLARAFLFKARFATLMNVAANEEVAPEFIQTRFSVRNIANAAGRLLSDEAARLAQVERQNAALARMGRLGRPAADVAADAVLGVLNGAL